MNADFDGDEISFGGDYQEDAIVVTRSMAEGGIFRPWWYQIEDRDDDLYDQRTGGEDEEKDVVAESTSESDWKDTLIYRGDGLKLLPNFD